MGFEDKTVEHKVKDILKDQFGYDVFLLDEHNLVKDLGADSLDVIEIIMLIEEKFDVEIIEPVDGVGTVGEIVKYVESIT